MGRLWGGWRHWGRLLVVGSNDGEDGGEEGETVEYPVQHGQPEDLEEGDGKGDEDDEEDGEEDDEDLEEGDEDVGGGKGKDDDRQQGGDACVHDGRAKGDQGILSPFRWRA